MRSPWCPSMTIALALRVKTASLGPCFIIWYLMRLSRHMASTTPTVVDQILTLRLAVTQHNLVFQARLMGKAREAIINNTFPSFLKTFFANYFGDQGYPKWCIDALRTVNVDLLDGRDNIKIREGDGAKWEYAEAS